MTALNVQSRKRPRLGGGRKERRQGRINEESFRLGEAIEKGEKTQGATMNAWKNLQPVTDALREKKEAETAAAPEKKMEPKVILRRRSIRKPRCLREEKGVKVHGCTAPAT